MDVLVALNAKVDGILEAIQTMGGGRKSLVQTFSPLNISEYGKRVSDEIGLEKYIDDNWEYISSHISSNSESLNLYDIQQLCFNMTLIDPERTLSTKGYDIVKSKAYLEGMSAVSMLQLASIIIRNKYFEENKLNIDDIDEYTPKS